MAAIGTAIRMLALLMLYKISNPKILNLVNAEESKTLKMRAIVQDQTKSAVEGGAVWSECQSLLKLYTLLCCFSGCFTQP